MRPADPGLKDSPFKLKGPEKKNLPQSEDRNKTVKLLTNNNNNNRRLVTLAPVYP